MLSICTGMLPTAALGGRIGTAPLAVLQAAYPQVQWAKTQQYGNRRGLMCASMQDRVSEICCGHRQEGARKSTPRVVRAERRIRAGAAAGLGRRCSLRGRRRCACDSPLGWQRDLGRRARQSAHARSFPSAMTLEKNARPGSRLSPSLPSFLYHPPPHATHFLNIRSVLAAPLCATLPQSCFAPPARPFPPCCRRRPPAATSTFADSR